MGRVQKEVGLWLAAVGGVAWNIAAVALDSSIAVKVGFVALGVGLFLLGWAVRTAGPILGSFGALLALGGIAPFTMDLLSPFAWTKYYAPLALFIVGLLAFAAMAVRGLGRDAALGAVFQVVAGACLTAAGALWVLFDLDGGEHWQAGNVLTLLGGLLLVFGKARTTRAT